MFQISTNKLSLNCLIVGLFFLASNYSFAQISAGGQPKSFASSSNLSSDVPMVEMVTVNVEALLEEDLLNDDLEKPYRFGKELPVKLNLNNSGSWETLENGDRVWRIAIYSKAAKTLNFIFREYELPVGAKLHIYNGDKSELIGAFTNANNKPYRKLSTGLLRGELAVLELFEPSNVVNQSKLDIGVVIHGYRGIFDKAKGYGDSGNCNNNVNCPISVGWENEIRSVAMILEGGFRACTGAMINNVNNDCTPYFLTANHCLSSSVETWVFMFNYESPNCDNQDGPTDMTVSGCFLRASNGASDFALCELSTLPPPDYNVYLSGFSASDIPAPGAIGIHHPAGDIKKFSIDEDPLVSSEGLSGVPDSHWRVTQWEDGTTEPGSSGSPLFDLNHRIVGQLHGGSASCSSITEDEYGKVFHSWDSGASANSRLSDWLDPNGTGITEMDGKSCVEAPNFMDAGISQVVSPVSGTFCAQNVTPSFVIRNYGGPNIVSATINYQWDDGTIFSFPWIGDLEYLESEIVTLTSTDLDFGAHTFSVFLTDINGSSSDENPDNNGIAVNFSLVDGQAMTVQLEPGFYAQMEVEIVNSANESVLYANNISNAYVNTLCLASDCYTATFTVGFGFGTSSYTLIDQNGDELSSEPLDDGESIEYEFCLIQEEQIVDASISSFISPVSSTICSEEITPEIQLLNLGGIELTEGVIEYQINDGPIQTQNWSGSLDFLESTTITLPNLPTPAGEYTISVSLVSPNGTSDEDDSNNTISTTFTTVSGAGFIVELSTDDYGEETSFAIFDEEGNELASQSGPFPNFTTFVYDYCVGFGCYEIQIYDSYGDGIFQPGSFLVYDLEGGILAEMEFYEFEQQDLNFCIEPLGANANFSVSYNPACVNTIIDFEAQTLGDYDYNWDFGPATVVANDGATQSVFFPEPGTYNVNLGFMSEDGPVSATQEVVINDVATIGTLDIVDATDETTADGSISIPVIDGTPPFSYEWSTGDVTSTGSLDGLLPDQYSVEIIDAAGCIRFVAFGIGTQVGIDDSVFPELSIYPSLTNNEITISGLPNEPINFSLVDLQGRVVAEKSFVNQGQFSYSLRNLPAGTYFVKLAGLNGSRVEKVLKY